MKILGPTYGHSPATTPTSYARRFQTSHSLELHIDAHSGRSQRVSFGSPLLGANPSYLFWDNRVPRRSPGAFQHPVHRVFFTQRSPLLSCRRSTAIPARRPNGGHIAKERRGRETVNVFEENSDGHRGSGARVDCLQGTFSSTKPAATARCCDWRSGSVRT